MEMRGDGGRGLGLIKGARLIAAFRGAQTVSLLLLSLSLQGSVLSAQPRLR